MSARFQIFGVPVVGMELWQDDQRFIATAVEPYQRRDGGQSFLVTWGTNCPDCGAEFQSGTGTGGAPPRRRCPGCRLPPARQRPISGNKRTAIRIEIRYPTTAEGKE